MEILRLSGESPCDEFGLSLSGAGDFNGDGYEDLIVGAPFVRYTGRAYLYYGGPGRDSLADLILIGGERAFLFGLYVSTASDFNSDGFDDVIVGTNNYFDYAYVYFGGRPPDLSPDLSLVEPYVYRSAALAHGDVNGDGYSDIVLGLDGAFASPDKVVIYFGGPGADAVADLELAASPSDLVGSEVSCADFNGDGLSDVIVGSASGIRIYYGGTDMDSSEDFGLAGPRIEGDSWFRFASAGDLNGDGAADVVVGSEHRAFVFFGGSAADSIPDVILPGPDSAWSFGSSATSLGDVNGDGFGDLLVTANLGFEGGRVYLFLGGALMDSIPDAEVENTTPLGGFGWVLSAADVNGDGVPDALVSMPGPCSSGAGSPGLVFVYDFSQPLASRAFLQGGNRTISLVQAPSSLCVRFEPLNGSYDNANVDFSTVRLASSETGEVREIAPIEAKPVIGGDMDRDGVAELSACFARSDLARLLSSVRGRRTIDIALEGRLTTRRKFSAPFEVTIQGTPAAEHGITASVSPNPLNPTGVLKFTVSATGTVTVRLFDVLGRLVRTVVQDAPFEAGEHSLRIDGRDDQDVALATGVYFYRIQTPVGASQGRFVVAK